MSGAETVASLVLGILPLLIATAEHYDTILRPFKRYRRYAPELGLYQKQLGTQKTIFRNECMLVLTALTDNQTAKSMLKGSSHPSWTDSVLDESFAQRLGDSGNACKTLIDLIGETLKAVEEEAENFGLVIQESIPFGSIGDKAWRERVKKKLKFSVAEPRLRGNIEDLRKHNQDLIILARQITKLDHQTRSNLLLDPALRRDTKFEERRMVHDASSRLYNALERACKLHTEHLVLLRLVSQQVDVQDLRSTIVRFNLGFTRHHGITSSMLEPVWIGVESIFNESTKASEENSRHGNQRQLAVKPNNLEHYASTSSTGAKSIKISSVRFSFPTQCGSGSSDSSLFGSLLDNPSLPDFCIQHDFCHELEKCGRQTPKNKYIGYFEKAAPCKHLVYFSPPTLAGGSDTVSLAEIVSKISKGAASDHLLQYKIFRLAGKLASAVLQFHATPMLKKSWRSNDVVFSGKDPESASITSPHLQVHVVDSASRSDNLIVQQERPPKRDVFIRNPYLFNLGIVLIELAYQAPISSLRQESDLINSQDDKHADFFAAIRLSETMATSLGPVYAKMVRKCLWCDFGEGVTDLGDPALQASVYTNIVCELDRLEKDFAKLQLAE